MPQMFQTTLDEVLGKAKNKDIALNLVKHAIEAFRRLYDVKPYSSDPVTDKLPEDITLDDYQQSALLTANEAQDFRSQVMNTVLGLGGETGEVVEALAQASVLMNVASAKTLDDIKKYFFHSWSDMHIEKPGSYEKIREKIGKELGDMLWYIAVLSNIFDFTMGELAKMNRQKLIERHGIGVDNSSSELEVHAHYSDGSSEKLFSYPTR